MTLSTKTKEQQVNRIALGQKNQHSALIRIPTKKSRKWAVDSH